MATRRSTKAATKRTHTPKPNKKEQTVKNTEKDNKALATREPSDQHRAFAEWIAEQTNVAVNPKAVQLVTTLRAQWNRSDANKAHREQVKEERELAKAARAEKQEERRQKQLERLTKQAEKLGMSIQAVQAQKNEK